MKTASSDITQLLLAWGNGEKEALDKLIPLIHEELHRLASRQMRKERSGHTLQTTALVNEAYCKLIDLKQVQWQNRAHFFAIAARLMRRILVDHARSRARVKRGSTPQKISLNPQILESPKRTKDWIALDDALLQLMEFDAQKSRIVEMKFFGGLTTQEIAEVEKISTSSVEREWRKARAWLLSQMRD